MGKQFEVDRVVLNSGKPTPAGGGDRKSPFLHLRTHKVSVVEVVEEITDLVTRQRLALSLSKCGVNPTEKERNELV